MNTPDNNTNLSVSAKQLFSQQLKAKPTLPPGDLAPADTERLMREFNRKMDDYLVDNVDPTPIKDAKKVSLADFKEYRRQHLSKKAQRRLAELLARRCLDRLEMSEDILVRPYQFPWDWRHEQIVIRSECFHFIELEPEIVWSEQKMRSERQRCGAEAENDEGWLLVEDHQVVGAAFFSYSNTRIFTGAPAWHWNWVFVDPEYQRKGFVTKRIPSWRERYSDFVIDQPNPAACRMLRKLGLYDAFLITDIGFDVSGGHVSWLTLNKRMLGQLEQLKGSPLTEFEVETFKEQTRQGQLDIMKSAMNLPSGDLTYLLPSR